MRKIAGSLVLIALSFMLGCGGPTSPSPVVSLSPATANMKVGETQVFTVKGLPAVHDYYIFPAVSTFCTVALKGDTISVTYTKKGTVMTTTLTVSWWDRNVRKETKAVINFE